VLVDKELFSKFQNHSSQMAAIDFMVSPTMATRKESLKAIEGL
jgi:hypothetical protein